MTFHGKHLEAHQSMVGQRKELEHFTLNYKLKPKLHQEGWNKKAKFFVKRTKSVFFLLFYKLIQLPFKFLVKKKNNASAKRQYKTMS